MPYGRSWAPPRRSSGVAPPLGWRREDTESCRAEPAHASGGTQPYSACAGQAGVRACDRRLGASRHPVDQQQCCCRTETPKTPLDVFTGHRRCDEPCAREGEADRELTAHSRGCSARRARATQVTQDRRQQAQRRKLDEQHLPGARQPPGVLGQPGPGLRRHPQPVQADPDHRHRLPPPRRRPRRLGLRGLTTPVWPRMPAGITDL